MHKWDGTREVVLSLSQLKQIAGRAGRFGLHGDDSPGGVATTLHEPDLPVLRQALSSIVSTSIKRAVLPSTSENHSAIEQVLSAPAKFRDVFEIINYVSTLSPSYSLRSMPASGEASAFIDRFCSDFSLQEKLMLFLAPVAWRDELSNEAMIRFIRMYREKGSVDLWHGLRDLGVLEVLEDVKQMQEAEEVPNSSPQTLAVLEGLYKIVICYIWLSFRSPLAFNLQEEAVRMKHQTEAAIDWCLEGLQSRRSHLTRPSSDDIESFGIKKASTTRLIDGPPTQIHSQQVVEVRS